MVPMPCWTPRKLLFNKNGGDEKNATPNRFTDYNRSNYPIPNRGVRYQWGNR